MWLQSHSCMCRQTMTDEHTSLGQVRCTDCNSSASDTTWELVDEDDDREVYHITCETCGATADCINKTGFNSDLALDGDVEPVRGLVEMHTEDDG